MWKTARIWLAVVSCHIPFFYEVILLLVKNVHIFKLITIISVKKKSWFRRISFYRFLYWFIQPELHFSYTLQRDWFCSAYYVHQLLVSKKGFCLADSAICIISVYQGEKKNMVWPLLISCHCKGYRHLSEKTVPRLDQYKMASNLVLVATTCCVLLLAML